MGEFSEDEKAALLDMLKAMVVFEPGDWMTAQQVVESRWMKEWGLPQLSRLKEAEGRSAPSSAPSCTMHTYEQDELTSFEIEYFNNHPTN